MTTCNFVTYKMLLFSKQIKKRPIMFQIYLFVFGIISAMVIIGKYNFLTENQINNINDVYMSVRLIFVRIATEILENKGNGTFNDHEVSLNS